MSFSIIVEALGLVTRWGVVQRWRALVDGTLRTREINVEKTSLIR
jgi:hypothetical protein